MDVILVLLIFYRIIQFRTCPCSFVTKLASHAKLQYFEIRRKQIEPFRLRHLT